MINNKILLATFITYGLAISGAHALGMVCYFAPNSCLHATADSSCTTICRTCTGSIPSVPTGYTGRIVSAGVYTTCNNGNSTYHCNCGVDPNNSMNTLACASGYYGSASLNYMAGTYQGCTKCPSNATCAGGNGSTFVCNANYYKNGGRFCSACPSSGRSSRGSTSITSCYLPSGTTGSDSTGSYTYTSNCYYSL